MAINYSLTLRSSNPLRENAPNLVYAQAQYANLVSLDQLAEHIAHHGSSFSRGTISAVLMEAVDCLREQLLLGNKVQLGDLGAFYCTLRSEGAATANDYSVERIRAVKVNWEPTSRFRDLRQDASFRYVATREAQADARKREKQDIDKVQQTPGTNSGSVEG